MKKTLLLAALLFGATQSDVSAQTRDLGAQRIVLDNGGFQLSLQAPALTGNGTFTFPNPATTGGTFVMTQSTTGQAITGPLSVTVGQTSLSVAGNDAIYITSRDQAFGDFPLIIQTNNTGLTYGSQTYNRMMRFDQAGVGFFDLGVDPTGGFFVTQLNTESQGLRLSGTGDLWVNGNITLNGTVDGIDVATADAQNVKLSGAQSVTGTKTFSAQQNFDNGVRIGASGGVMTEVLTATAVLDFPLFIAGVFPYNTDLTINVPGAAVGDVVSLAVPANAPGTYGNFFAWVSAPNTVTIRHSVIDGGPANLVNDPPSGAYRVMVTKF